LGTVDATNLSHHFENSMHEDFLNGIRYPASGGQGQIVSSAHLKKRNIDIEAEDY
jgi:hypothetical protein